VAKTFAGVVTPVLEPRLAPGETLRGGMKLLGGEEQREGVVAMAELLAAAHGDPA
jgi:hypothetical protein